jgi:hypothetical protein
MHHDGKEKYITKNFKPGVRLGPFGTSATIWLIVPAPYDGR